MRRRNRVHPKYYEYRELLKEAFQKIREQGIIARMNFLCCGSCASYDLNQRLEKDKSKKGYVFWHRQDEDHFKYDGCVFLGYASSQDDFGTNDKAIGESIVKVLTELNIPCKWNGDPSVKIQAGNIVP